MMSFIEQQKKLIEDFLAAYIERESKKLKEIDPIGSDVCSRLFNFIKKGKMLRGALVQLGYSLFKEGNPEEVVCLGCVLELLQSALLIHDDIMDRDINRRGEQSVFYQYVKKAEDSGLKEPYHIGEALGICAGDVGFFLAFGLISHIEVDERIKTKILDLCAREMSYVGIAQMLDVIWGADSSNVQEESVLKLYRYKTGRYTFSLPLVLGAITAGATGDSLVELEEIGEILGIVFQLKDDEIGLYGDENVIGKPVGSDIKEGKKTLYSYFLYNQANADDREMLSRIFGNKTLTFENVTYIRELVDRLGIRQIMSQKMEEYSCIASNKINKLSVTNIRAKETLVNIIEYNMSRRY